MNEVWAEDEAEELRKSLYFVVQQSHLPPCFELCLKNNFLVADSCFIQRREEISILIIVISLFNEPLEFPVL
jgi:hypothetical protein